MKERIFSLLTAIALIITLFPQTLLYVNAGSIASGTSEENLQWELDSDGVLIISGTGAMKDYSPAGGGYPSWLDANIGEDKQYIDKVILSPGITNIGEAAFAYCSTITSIEIPDTVTEIGDYAFLFCGNLKEIVIPDSVVSIGALSLCGCGSLSSIAIPASVNSIGVSAFKSCDNLAKIVFAGNAPTVDSTADMDVFDDVVATAYYPRDNSTWTDEVMRSFGGKVAWEPYDAGMGMKDNVDDGIEGVCTPTVEEVEQMVADYYNRQYQDEAYPGTHVVFHGETTVSGNTCNMVVRFQSSSSSPTTAANVLVAFVSVDMRTGVMTIETIDGDIEVRLLGSVVETQSVEIPAPIATMTAFNNFFVENYYDNFNRMYQYNSVAQGIVENSSVFQINWNSCLSALSNKEYVDVLKLENHPEYYYQTVLFESIMQTKLSDDYLSALADQISSISIEALSFYVSYDANFNSYEDVLKQKLNATMTDFSIDSVQYKRLKDYYGQYCKQLNSFETMKGIYDLVVKADGSVGDFFNALSRYTSVYEASEETITALKYLKKILELSTDEEDQYIITAVNNVLFSLERTLDRQLLLNCMATAKDLLWDVFWAAIQDAFPQMLAMDIASFTVDTGLALSNVLFPTTISSDSYCKVYADYAVETVMRQALYEAYNSYVASPTEEMATVTVGLYDLLGYTYAHEIEVAAVLSEQLHKDGFLNELRNLFSEKNMATYEYEQECIKAYGAYLNDIKAVKVEAQTAYGLTTGSIQPVIVVYMVNGKVVTTTESAVATGDVYSLPSGEIDLPDFIGLYLEIGGYYTDEKLTNPYEETCVTKPLSLYCNVLLRRTSDQVPVLVDHSTGISVSRGESMDNYVLRAELVESGNIYESTKKFFNGAELDLYDISLSFDGSTVQPDGSVLVQIPIDDEHAKMEGTVYYVVSDGKYSNVNATYENKSYYFRTTHFSNYLIVYESKESNWYIPLFVIVAICVMGVGVVMLSKKKKNRK